MLVGELGPKNLAIARPVRVAVVVVPALRAFTAAVSPLITFMDGSARRLLLAVGVQPREELPAGRSLQERAITRGERRTHDVMVELEKIVTLPAGCTPAEAEDTIPLHPEITRNCGEPPIPHAIPYGSA